MFVFCYATYPRLFAMGIGNEGFALTAQRMMLLFMMLMFALRYMYGAEDVRRGLRILRQEGATLLLFSGLLVSRLIGNLTTGRLDLAAIVSFVDEAVFTLFIVLLVFTCIRNRRDINILLLVIALSLLPNQLIAVYEFITQGSIFPASLRIDFETARAAEDMLEGGARYGLYRVMGTFENPLKLMAISVLTVPIVVYLRTLVREPMLRNMLLFVLVMQPVVIFWTGSRTGLIMLVLVLGGYAYQFVNARFGRLESTILVLVMALAAATVLALTGKVIVDSFLFSSEGSKSTTSRFLQYAFSIPLVQESPLFGYGYARNIVDIIDIKRMDGYYLRTVMEGGLVALGCLLALYWRSIRMLNRLYARTKDDIAVCLRISLGAMAVMMLALNMGTSSFYTYMFFGVVVMLDRQARASSRVVAPPPMRQAAAAV